MALLGEHASYVCQQCKQPFQLDTSLEELSPSAYDMIAGSLPHPPAPPPLSPAEKLARLPASPTSKAAWLSAQRPGANRAQTTPSHGNTPGHSGPSAANPADSFVLLQESVLQTPRSPHPPGSGARTRPKAPTVHSALATPTAPAPSKRHAAAAAQGLSVRPPSADSPAQQQQPQPHSPPVPRAHNLRHLHRLFELVSSRTDVDHPLCAECAHALMDGLNKQLEEVRRERDGYIAFEKEAKRELEKGKGVMDVEIAHLEKLKADEKAAVADLKSAEAELQKLSAELLSLEADERSLSASEGAFWAQHSGTQIASSNLRTSLSSLRAAIRTSERELDALERTNVYDDAFCLGSDGVFGTINGLRLGRAGTVLVEWAEVNAAWGQTLLLLHTIARKMEFAFETWRLHPMGSFSRIARVNGEAYELYASTDLVVTRLLHNRRFDFAMVAFLDCLRQITDHAKRLDPSLDFLHPISKDKIGDASVKLQFSQEEQWTRAMRFILVVLKLLLKWVVNMDT